MPSIQELDQQLDGRAMPATDADETPIAWDTAPRPPDAPAAEAEGASPDPAPVSDVLPDIPSPLAQAFASAAQKAGKCPSWREVEAAHLAMTGKHLRHNNATTRMLHELRRLYALGSRQTDTVSAAESALEDAVQAIARVEAGTEALEALMATLNTDLAALKLRLEVKLDVSAVEPIKEKTQAVRDAERELEKHRPLMLAEVQAARDAAAQALKDARQARARAKYQALAAERRVLCAPDGPLAQTLAQFLDSWTQLQALTAAQRDEASLLQLNFDTDGVPPERLSALWVWQQLLPNVPLPFDRVPNVLEVARPLPDLAAADRTCHPATEEELGERRGSNAVVLVRQDRARVLSLASCGIARSLAEQERFANLMPLRFTLEEAARLRAHYGEDCVRAVAPPVWAIGRASTDIAWHWLDTAR